MKKSPNSNIYGFGIEEAFELFADHLRGPHEARVCVISTSPLSEAASNAIEKSVEALDMGAGCCTFATIDSLMGDSGEGFQLDASALYLLVEGLDARAIVVADRQSASLLSLAYHQEVKPGSADRLGGRTVVAFEDFSSLLDTNESKRIAWTMLKKLTPKH